MSSEVLLKVKPELLSASADTTTSRRTQPPFVSVPSASAADAGCVLPVTHFDFLLRAQVIKRHILIFTGWRGGFVSFFFFPPPAVRDASSLVEQQEKTFSLGGSELYSVSLSFFLPLFLASAASICHFFSPLKM